MNAVRTIRDRNIYCDLRFPINSPVAIVASSQGQG